MHVGFDRVTHRTGPLCTPAFAMTDRKSQGKQFPQASLNLKGVYGSGTVTKPTFMSLYVHLSRAERWEGLYLFRKPARGDFMEPMNELDRDMRDMVLKLETLGTSSVNRLLSSDCRFFFLSSTCASPPPATSPL